jgi:hypothetical protein
VQKIACLRARVLCDDSVDLTARKDGKANYGAEGLFYQKSFFSGEEELYAPIIGAHKKRGAFF